MIIIDTSVWIEHFRREEALIGEMLIRGDVRHHPLVTAELAMGNLREWRRTINLLDSLPQAPLLPQDDMLAFVERTGLAGSGLGVVDAHLLGSAQASGGRIWTRDRRLSEQADRLGLAYRL